jgi:hypothetical protein
MLPVSKMRLNFKTVLAGQCINLGLGELKRRLEMQRLNFSISWQFILDS